MKTRNGFVSNSSSSSFICEICGTLETGYNCGPAEVGFEVCEHEHIFCKKHLDKVDKEITYKEDDYWGGEAVTEDCCPICTLKDIDDSLLLRYLKHKFSVTEKEVINEIQRDFKNLAELLNHLEE
jgi:hypothetical protein